MTAAPVSDTRFRLSAAVAQELATRFDTPLYVIDEAHLRARIREYIGAFRAVAPKCELSFASKANSTLAVLAIAYQEGCVIDAASEGELRAALAAGVPANRCHSHGNNKTEGELHYGIEHGVGQIIVDHFGEIEMLKDLTPSSGTNRSGEGETKFVLRLAPGVDPITHAKISTGQADTKFGFNIVDGSAERATKRCLELGLPLIGYHCHVGSQLLDPEAQRSGGELVARFAVEMMNRHGFAATYLNLGGGLGVRYTDADEPMPVSEYNRLVVESVRKVLEGSGLDPVLGQEPGRALVAESGVTLYRVGVVKTVPAKEIGTRTYVCVDGGLSDNPRPALYGSHYTVERVSGTLGSQVGSRVTVSGKHCESDKLFEDVELPGDVAAGDRLQVLCTGAYNSSMASNYNRYPRPATVLLRQNGEPALVQRRDTWNEMLAREVMPEGLA